MSRTLTNSKLTVFVLAAALALGGASTVAVAREATVQINIASQSLSEALLQLAEQTRLQVFFAPETVAGVSAPEVRGQMVPEEALDALLEGSGVTYQRSGNGVTLSRNPTGATQLLPITVAGRLSATTEGTGSYTTPATAAATGLQLTLRDTPQSVSVITTQRLQDQSLQSLDQVLSNTTGIYVVGSDTDRTDFYSRGFYVNNLQYDGVPTSLGLSMFGESSTDSIIYDRIEVVRGATGLLTGAGTPSASINLVRKHADSKVFTGSVALGAGSWDLYRGSIDLSTPLSEDGTVRGRIIAMTQEKDSYMDLYSAKKQVFYGVIDADLTSRTTLSIGADYQTNRPVGSTWGGLPTVFSDGTETDWRRSKTVATDWTYWNTTNSTLFAGLEHRFDSGWKARGNVAHRSSKYDAKLLYLYGDIDRISGEGLRTLPGYFDSEFEQDTVDLQATGPIDLLGRRHELVFGLNASRSKQDDYNHTVASVPASTGNFYDWDGSYAEPAWGNKNLTVSERIRQDGIYAAARFSLTDPLKLIVGGRYTSWKSDGLLESRSENVFIPYAGVVFDINDTYSAYASYTDIFQPQSNRDRNGNYLDPESGENYEIGLKGEYLDGKVNAALAVFIVKQDNVAQADGDYVVPGTSGQAYTSAKGVTTRGLDGEVSGQITPRWNVALGGSYSTSKDADDVEINTAFVPRAQVRLFTTYRLAGAWKKLIVGGGVNWQSGNYVWKETAAGSVKVKQRPFSLVNLMARYEFTPQLSGQINVNNVFDKKYSMNLNQMYYGAPRSVFLTMNAKF